MLDEFDPAGGSSQGSGGIPLDQLGNARASLGVPEDPADTPEAQAVLDREVAELEAQRGGEPEPEPAPTEPPAEEPAPAEPTPDAAEAASPAEGAPEEDVDPAALKVIQKKYRGKFGPLTKDYARKDAALAESRQEISGLTTKINSLEKTVHNAIDRIGGQPVPGTAPAKAAETQQFSREDYDEDPAKVMYAISSQVAREHNEAMFKAMEQRDVQREQQRQIDSQQERLDYHKDRVNRIYQNDPEFWEALPRAKATEKLLEQADLVERAQTGDALWEDVNAPAPTTRPGSGDRTVRGGSPDYGSLGAGKSPRLRKGAPGSGPPAGGWDKTRAMENLRNARPDSTDEIMKAAEVLKERNFWPERGR